MLSTRRIKIPLYSYLIMLMLLFYNNIYGYTLTTIYTPNGASVGARIYTEVSDSLISSWNAEGDSLVTNNGLYATRIGDASQTYNCHAYAWHISEGGGNVWLNTPGDDTYWSDAAYGNGVESYVVVPEAYATKVSYTGGGADHSAVQTSYDSGNPSNSTYVSKWGKLGKYQHRKGSDPYSETDYNFYHAKYTHSGTISSSETWIKSKHQITGDINITSGTLTLAADAEVYVLAGYEIYINGGNLVSNGTSESNRPLIAKAPGGGNWDGIRISNTDFSLDYCEISGANDGIFMTGSNYGIDMEGCYIHGCTYTGLKLDDNTYAYLKDCIILASVNALYMLDGTMVDLGSDEPGGNVLHSTQNYVFYASNNVEGYWGRQSATPVNGGENSIYRSTSGAYYKIGYLSGSSTIDAQYNWWGGIDVCAYSFDTYSSTIDYDPYLTSDPNPLSKAAVSQEIVNVSEERKLFDSALKLSWDKNYMEAFKKYKEIIQQYPGSNYAGRALIRMSHLKKHLSGEDFISYLYDIMKNNEAQKERAYFVSVNHLLKEGYVMDAVDNCNYLLKNSKESAMKSYALSKLCKINLEYLNNLDRAEDFLADLKKEDIKNERIPQVSRLIDDFKNGKLQPKLSAAEIADFENEKLAKKAEEIPDEFGLLSNYPNPFNPVTNIRFALPEVSNVRIAIYNMLGQQVASLVNSQVSAGNHEVPWDGTNHASGMYICKMEAGKFSKAMKIMLVK